MNNIGRKVSEQTKVFYACLLRMPPNLLLIVGKEGEIIQSMQYWAILKYRQLEPYKHLVFDKQRTYSCTVGLEFFSTTVEIEIGTN